jgi:hypothetical protein
VATIAAKSEFDEIFGLWKRGDVQDRAMKLPNCRRLQETGHAAEGRCGDAAFLLK